MDSAGLTRIKVTLTVDVTPDLDVHALAGQMLALLTSQEGVKRAAPTRILEARNRNGSVEWRDVEYWREETTLASSGE